jgi:Flp pilus assembly protein TadB
MRKTRARREPVRAVITEAEESIPAQLRRREIRYAWMMGLRAVCIVAAVLITTADVPYAMVWVGLCILGMILLPWMAVLVANDRLPKKDSRFSAHFGGHPAPERALPPANPVIDLEPEPRVWDQRPTPGA